MPCQDSFDSNLAVADADAALVCHCHRVTEATIRQTIDEGGAESVEEITERTHAGSACRGCHDWLERMLMGLSPKCGEFALCGSCGCVAARCDCKAA